MAGVLKIVMMLVIEGFVSHDPQHLENPDEAVNFTMQDSPAMPLVRVTLFLRRV